MSRKWSFFKSARCVQVKLESGEDIAALPELDQKLWTVLSASLKGLRFDDATLKLLDSDCDGRIRVPEVLSAIEWLKLRFKNLDFLLARKDEISLADLNENTPEGKTLLESFKNILARENNSDKSTISLSSVLGATKLFNDQPLNGDGVVTPKSTSDQKLSTLISQIIATEGAVKDASGDDGVNQALADKFFASCSSYLNWINEEQKALAKIKDSLSDPKTIGFFTESSYKAYADIKEKIDEYFTPPEDLPLVAEDPTPSIPLTQGVNPAWQEKFSKFSIECSYLLFNCPQGSFKPSITRAEWAEVKDKMEPYGIWLSSKPNVPVANLGEATLREIVADGKAQALINDLIASDSALAGESSAFADCERALRYSANLMTWLCNYVNQANLYDTKSESVFRTGELYIDGRVCKLCFHVENDGAHSALAAKSKCCLLYMNLSRPSTKETRKICAVVTAGSTSSLYSGRNGIFYDCEGKDWDAVVAKVVEAQVSLREAFWAPWAKIATTISEQCKKFLSSKQDAAVAKVGEEATSAATVPAANTSNGANGAALASSVAALGVGVGMAGAACAGLIGLIAGLPLWKVLAGVVAIILIVSLPSVVLAWFKLRARDLGAILNAGGWAVNRPLHFSIGLARTFTRPADMPAGAAVARDPYASNIVLKILIVLLILTCIAAVVSWKLVK